MTQVTYLIGEAVTGRRRLSEAEMSSRGISPENSLRIVPTQGVVYELENLGPGWVCRPVDTMASIVNRIFYDDILYQSFRNFSSMDDTMRELAVRVILHRRNQTPEGLGYFSALFSPPLTNEHVPGIYRQILEFFSLLVSNSFEDDFVDLLSHRMDQLDDLNSGAGEERYALDADLALLFGDYEEFKRSNLLYDRDDVIAAVRSFLVSGKSPSLLRDIRAIVFDGFVTITRAEEEILFHLFRNVDELLWLIDFDPQEADPLKAFRRAAGHGQPGEDDGYEAFSICTSLIPLMDQIEQAGFPTTVKRASYEVFSNPFAGCLYRPGQYDDSKAKGLKVKSFKSRLDEVREIAGEIKKLVNKENTRDLDRIRVIFPDLSEYSCLISEIFQEYGIPFNMAKGVPLLSSPLLEIFRLLIDIPLNNFRRDDIYRFFSSSLIDPIDKAPDTEEQRQWLQKMDREGAFFGGEKTDEIASFLASQVSESEPCRLDIGALDGVARKCGSKGGEILSEFLPRARDYFSFQCSIRPAKETEGILSEYYAFILQLFHLNRNLDPFRELSQRTTPRKVVQGLFRLLDKFQVEKNILSILKDENGPISAASEKIIRTDMMAFTTLKDLTVKAGRDLEKTDTFITSTSGVSLLARFKGGFEALVSRARIVEDRYQGAIDVSECTDVLGCSLDYAFLGGLSAEEFPLGEPDDFILPESSLGPLRKTNFTDLSRHIVSYVLCNCRRCIYLSYPRSIRERNVQPSPVLLDMVSLVNEGELFTGIEELERSFPWEDNPYFTSEQQFLDTEAVERKVPVPPNQSPFTHKHIILGDNRFLNESIMRGVQSLLARNTVDALTEHDGLVFNARNWPHYLSEAQDIFSTSRLDMMANCPMHYLFSEIFSLEPVEELEEQLSPREMGFHIHAILKMVFETLKRNRENVASAGLPKVFSLAREIGESYFSQLDYLEGLDFFEAQKSSVMEGLETASTSTTRGLPKREGLIAQMLRFEEANLSQETVSALEYRFGEGSKKPVKLGKTKIRGYIDRVDSLIGDEEVSIIYDYKTGRAPALSEIKKGLSFQLPGYVAALAAEKDIRGLAARYYLIERRRLSEGNALTSPIGYQYPHKVGIDLSGVKLIGDYADEIVSLMKKGMFHHSTEETPCSYCEFRYACYKNTRRMAHLVDSWALQDIYSGKKNLERWKEVENVKKRWNEIQKKMDVSRTVKQESKRREVLERAVDFKNWLVEKRSSLPFDETYITQIIESIEAYERSF